MGVSITSNWNAHAHGAASRASRSIARASALGFAVAAALATANAAVDRVAAAEAAPRAISLDEAVALPLRNNPRAVQARGETRASEAQVRSSYAAFIPNLSASAGATRRIPAGGGETRIVDGQLVTFPKEPWSYSTGLSANLDLFDGGRRFFDLRQARAGVRSAEAGEIAEEFGVALDAKQEYFNVLAARESEIAAHAQLAQAEQQFTSAIARVRAGSGTKSDSLRSEIQLINARLAVFTAQTDLEIANVSLTRVVGSEEPVTASDEETLNESAIRARDEDLRRAVESGPAVRDAEARLVAARAAHRASRTTYLPSLGASYSYGGSGTDNRFGFGEDPFDYSGAFRLSMSLPLFNQLNREEQIVRASVAEENAEAALRDTRLAALENLAIYLGAYRRAAQSVAAQSASVAASEEDLRVQQQRYGMGNSTLLDLLTSQSQLTAARDALIRARYDQRVAKAQLEVLAGQSL